MGEGQEFTCAICDGTFVKKTPEDKALAELKEFFGDVPVEDCVIVCGVCWEKMRPDRYGFTLPVSKGDVLERHTIH